MRNSIQPTDDDIHLGIMLNHALESWRPIAALTLIGAAAALGISVVLPKQYDASAIVVLTKPDVVFQFDSRIRTQFELPPLEVLPQIAQTADIFDRVMESAAAESLPPESRTVDALIGMTEVSVSGTALELVVRDQNPERAAALANTWASEVVGKLQAIYAPSTIEAQSFEQRALEARESWEAAQNQLVEFRSANDEAILKQRLAAIELALANSLRSGNNLKLVLNDLENTHNRLLTIANDSEFDPRDELLSIILATRTLVSSSSSVNSMGERGTETSIGEGTVHLTGGGLDTMLSINIQGLLLDRIDAEHSEYLSQLIESVNGQLTTFEEQQKELEEQLLLLQGKLAETEAKRSRLELDRGLARENYQALARKAAETNAAIQDQGSVAQVAGLAVKPGASVSPSIKLNALLGAVLGMLLGLSWSFLAPVMRKR